VSARFAAIRDRIQLLAAIDPEVQIFGANRHRHTLAPPIDDDGIAALEAQFGALPDEYRAFLRTIAAGGAGPYYGLENPTVPEDPQHALQPDPARSFSCDHETPYDAKLADGASVLDGTLYISEQGCGGRSLLVIRGPHAGEVWSDWTSEQGTIQPEAKSIGVWYEQWIERALLEWIERAAPRIALDGPANTSELEAIAIVFDLVAKRVTEHPQYARCMGYLHLREERWDDAGAAFVRAARAPDAAEPEARLALDRARLALKRECFDDAVACARLGLATPNIWYATRDELRDTLERAFTASNRHDDALAVLDQRAAERFFSLDLHHRLARERLARNDLGNAGAVLERAARMNNILGLPLPIEDRVPASFEPIIAELRAAGRYVDADALAARATLILEAN
jgi:hypothetical protein